MLIRLSAINKLTEKLNELMDELQYDKQQLGDDKYVFLSKSGEFLVKMDIRKVIIAKQIEKNDYKVIEETLSIGVVRKILCDV